MPRTKKQENESLEQMFRDGPLAPGEADYHVVDYYEVTCGAEVTTVIMDMYHCHQNVPTQAPPQFTITPPQ